MDLIGTRQVTAKQHDQYILANDQLKGGVFMSAKTGENVVKAFYKVRRHFACSERVRLQILEVKNNR